MNKIYQYVLICCFLFSTTCALAAGVAPTEIAGIRLGSDIQDYENIVQTNFLKEVVITDWRGFRKGVISYGICRYKNQILKIDMKYADKSEEFYKKLLDRFRKRFGKPNSFEGDSFGVMRVWKWRFTDKNNNAISLTLQYNSKDTSETLGNMVKLTMPERLVEERRCFIKMCDEKRRSQTMDADESPGSSKPSWNDLIPE